MFTRKELSLAAKPPPLFHVLCLDGSHLAYQLADNLFHIDEVSPLPRQFNLHENSDGEMIFYTESIMDELQEKKDEILNRLMACILCVDVNNPNFLEDIKTSYDFYNKNRSTFYLVLHPRNSESYKFKINQAEELAKNLNVPCLSYKDAETHLFNELCQLARKTDKLKEYFGWENRTNQEIEEAIVSGTKAHRKLHRLKNLVHSVKQIGSSKNKDSQGDSETCQSAYFSYANNFFILSNLLEKNKEQDLLNLSYLVLANLFNLKAASDTEAYDRVETFKNLLESSPIGQWQKMRLIFFKPELPREIAHVIAEKYSQLSGFEI